MTNNASVTTHQPWLSPETTMHHLALLILLTTLGVLSVAILAVAKSSYFINDHLRGRPINISCLALAGLVCLVASPPTITSTPQSPCWLRPTFAILVIPALASSIALRGIYFVQIQRFAYMLAAYGGQILDEDDDSEPSGSGLWYGAWYGLKTKWEWLRLSSNYMRDAVFMTQYTQEELAKRGKTLSRHERVMILRILRYSLTGVGQVAYAIAASAWWVVPSIIYLAVAEGSYTNGCVGCVADAASLRIIIAIQLGYYIVVLSLLANHVKRHRDAFGILTKGLFSVVYFLISGACFVASLFMAWDDPRVFPLTVTAAVFAFLVVFQAAVVPVVARRDVSSPGFEGRGRGRGGNAAYDATRLPTTFRASTVSEGAQTHEYKGALVPMLQSGNAALIAAFREQVEAEFCPELLLFVECVLQWEKTFSDVSPSARLARAKRIIAVYVGRNAPAEVNVSHACVQRLFAALKEASTDPSTKLRPSLFAEVKEDVVCLLELGPLMRFVAKPEHAAALAQLGLDGTAANDVEALAPRASRASRYSSRSPSGKQARSSVLASFS